MKKLSRRQARLVLNGVAAMVAAAGLLYWFRQTLDVVFWFCCLLGLCGLVFHLWMQWRPFAAVERKLAAREVLSADEFGARYFPPDQVALAVRCHKLFARHYDFDGSRITPDERLFSDLKFSQTDPRRVRRFAQHVEQEFGYRIPEEKFGRDLTLRALVELLAKQSTSRPA